MTVSVLTVARGSGSHNKNFPSVSRSHLSPFGVRPRVAFLLTMKGSSVLTTDDESKSSIVSIPSFMVYRCRHLAKNMAPQAGFEPATRCLEGSRSIL